MSHQVRLSKLVFDNLEQLKKACAAEGLKMVDYMRGYNQTYNKGSAYSSNQTFEFGLEFNGRVPCGIAKDNKTGQYTLVGDPYGVSYRDGYGLEELTTRLNQRYRIQQALDAAEAHGLEPIEIPQELLSAKAAANARIEIKFQPKQQQTIQSGAVI